MSDLFSSPQKGAATAAEGSDEEDDDDDIDFDEEDFEGNIISA